MFLRMKLLRGYRLLVLGTLIGATGCASIGPPLPPSLELPRAPSDLRGVRKGDKVTLTWTVPALTTDRQSVRYLGKTRTCRGVNVTLHQCETAVGEAAPPVGFPPRKASGQKLAATFTDTLPSTIQQANPTGFATYAVEVLNTAGRSAGISNQVRVPLVPTIPPFGGFSAQAEAAGVLISWQCPPMSKSTPEIKYLLRIYRRPESNLAATKIAEIDATGCAQRPEGRGPQNSFLDQTFEWEHTYIYRGTVVSTVEVPGRPAIEVEGDDTPEVKVFAHDIFPPAVPSGLQAVFSGPGQ